MVIVKHMLGLLTAAAIVSVPLSATFAQTPAPQAETPAVEQAAPAPVALSRTEGEAVGTFLSRVQAAIAQGSAEEEAMAEQVASLLPPETTVTDAARSVVNEVLAFAQANPASAEAVGDGLALAANAASNANNVALARMIRVRVEGAPGLLAQAFSDNFTATAAGAGAGGAVGGGAGAGGGGAIGGAAGGGAGGGVGGTGAGVTAATTPVSTQTALARFSTGNSVVPNDVSAAD